MSIVAAVRTRILAISAVTALVNQRVHALVLPQGVTMPAIRLQQVGEVREMHLRGADRVAMARIQVDCCANGYESAHDVAAAVKGGFDSGQATGLIGWTGTAGGVEIVAVRPDGVREVYDPEELQQVKVASDYLVWFLEQE